MILIIIQDEPSGLLADSSGALWVIYCGRTGDKVALQTVQQNRSPTSTVNGVGVVCFLA